MPPRLNTRAQTVARAPANSSQRVSDCGRKVQSVQDLSTVSNVHMRTVLWWDLGVEAGLRVIFTRLVPSFFPLPTVWSLCLHLAASPRAGSISLTCVSTCIEHCERRRSCCIASGAHGPGAHSRAAECAQYEPSSVGPARH